MKFREYGKVLPRTIVGVSPINLDTKIEQFGNRHDIIDLQYAVAPLPSGRLEYSALVLYHPANNKEGI